MTFKLYNSAKKDHSYDSYHDGIIDGQKFISTLYYVTCMRRKKYKNVLLDVYITLVHVKALCHKIVNANYENLVSNKVEKRVVKNL